jgi:tRNA (guanine-N7-)-methyltransferase
LSPGHPFHDRPPEDYTHPDLNPYLRQYHTYGPPVLKVEELRAAFGRWSEVFGGSTGPLHVEIGSGNGHFLAGMAARHPEARWLGLDVRYKRVVLTASKIRALGLSNARIGRFDAFAIDEIFAPGEVAAFYLNHPDPWPKERHEKHRLMARPFAELASRLLAPGGFVRMKTDHRPNVERLVEALDGLPLRVTGRCNDYDRDGPPWPPADDVISSYQEKFQRRNEPVFALSLHRDGKDQAATAVPGQGEEPAERQTVAVEEP